MATKAKKKKVRTSWLAKELLETARDMHASGLLTKTAHDRITIRCICIAPSSKLPTQ
jgi:putative transcriptional regulator